ncbi:putative endo-1,4-beta-xylanase [Aspergillus lucknowensis]|uniref:Beta-xylanase n=1 Tax=Aspergillus lucknowensis TaxID=176173 RepID=A0ABR4LZ57_9EURO
MLQFLSLATALAAGTLPHPASAAGLNEAATAIGLEYFGTATDNPELTDVPYVAQLNNTADFGQITVGNSQKWDATEPTQNTFSFADGDAVVSLAEGNDQLVRCHTLVWYNQLPNWVTSGNWTNATLTAVMENHITKVVSHYKGRCHHWDVVNEALNEDGTYRDNIFLSTIGPSYIPLAFSFAAAADPDAKLYYNDYNLEYGGDKATAALDIVAAVQDAGAKIDGVGFQAHFEVGTVPDSASLATILTSFTDLGVEVAITEADIRIELPATEEALVQQAEDFGALAEACVGVEGCVGFTIWDYTDRYSWVPGVFPGFGAALPWDEDLVEKPAYDGLLEGLGGEAE